MLRQIFRIVLRVVQFVRDDSQVIHKELAIRILAQHGLQITCVRVWIMHAKPRIPVKLINNALTHKDSRVLGVLTFKLIGSNEARTKDLPIALCELTDCDAAAD